MPKPGFWPAFPHRVGETEWSGIDTRTYIATHALGFYLSTMPIVATYEELAHKCVRAADALLAELEK